MATNDPTNEEKTGFPQGVEVNNYEPSEVFHNPVELFYQGNKAQVSSSGRLLVDIGGTAELSVALNSSSVDNGGDNVQLKAFDGSDVISVACNSSGHLITSQGSSTQDVSIVSEQTYDGMNVSVFNASVTSSSIELDLGSNKEFIIRNRGSNDVYVLASTSSSTVTSTSGVKLGQDESLGSYGKASFTVFSAITDSGSSTVEVTVFGN